MKSTLLGLGSAPRGATRPAAPAHRGAPLLHPPTAPTAAAEPPTAPRPPEPTPPLPPVTAPEITEGDVRPRVRRPTETTQRVEVPRIRPPGTEPIQSGPTRVKVPLAMGRTIGGDVRAEEEVTVTESGEQPVPLQRLSAGAWGEIEASLGVLDDNDLEAISPPEAPVAEAPSAVDVTAPTVPPPEPAPAAMFDLSDSDFDPVVPPARVDATPAPAPFPDAADSISIEPELGATAPVEPPVAVVMPPTPIAPAMADPPPMPTPVPPMPMAPMPMVQPVAWTPPVDAPPPPPRPAVHQWAPTQAPPSDPTVRLDAMPSRRGGRMALVAGLTVLVAGVAGAAGWLVLHRDGPTVQSTPAPVRRPTPRAVVAARDGGVEAAVAVAVGDAAGAADATPVASADVLAPSDVAVAVAADAAVTPDAAVVVAAAVDAGAPDEPTGDPPGGTSEPPARLHSHPRAREIGDFIDALTPAVQRCVSGSERHRRVRVGVVWEGRTGRATEVHVGSTYAAAPMGPCLESAVRGRPITPFTDRDFETSLVFEAR